AAWGGSQSRAGRRVNCGLLHASEAAQRAALQFGMSPSVLVLVRFNRPAHGRLSKRNEPPLLFIPQRQPDTSQTLQQVDSSDRGKLRVVPQHVRQPITDRKSV